MVYTEKDFDKMLKADEEVYANLLQIKKLIEDHHKSWTAGKPINDVEFKKLQVLEDQYKLIKAKYEARQNDYKTNSVYKFSTTVSKWVSDFTDEMASYVGLGAAPIAVPVAWVIGIAAGAAVIAYFCAKYSDETQIDYSDSLKVIAEVAKVNPPLAKAMHNSLNELKKLEIENSGLKVSTVLKVVAGIGLVYLLYVNQEKVKTNFKKLIT